MSSELIENQGQQRHAINGLVVFNLNCCIFELNLVVFSLKNLPVKSKWTRKKSKQGAHQFSMHGGSTNDSSLKLPLFEPSYQHRLFMPEPHFCGIPPHIFLFSGAQVVIGCYRWSLDSAHMVPRWSQQSLGGHTWVNLSKVKGSLNMVTEGHFSDACVCN